MNLTPIYLKIFNLNDFQVKHESVSKPRFLISIVTHEYLMNFPLSVVFPIRSNGSIPYNTFNKQIRQEKVETPARVIIKGLFFYF